MPKLLKFVSKETPLLREVIPPITDFKDPLLHELIEDMCYSILPAQLEKAQSAHHSAAGMAANQWGIRKRIFVFTPEGSQPGNKIEIMINPAYQPLHPEKFELAGAYEGCFSIPLTTAVVYRYDAIVASYQTPAGERIEKVLEGWEARVFQHETDHLNGKLFDGQLDHFHGPECKGRIIFKNINEMDEFWKGGKK